MQYDFAGRPGAGQFIATWIYGSRLADPMMQNTTFRGRGRDFRSEVTSSLRRKKLRRKARPRPKTPVRRPKSKLRSRRHAASITPGGYE